MTAQATASAHPDIPSRLHPSIFPLYNPSTVDVVIFWELPAQKRAGHILLQGPTLGAGHAALKEIIETAETMKIKRSMYAETERERQAILEAVRNCEWNRETDPIAIFVQDGTVVEHDFRQGYVDGRIRSPSPTELCYSADLVMSLSRSHCETSRSPIRHERC